jgi:hypothetical protein
MSAGIRRMVSFTTRSCYSQRKNPVPFGYEVGWAPKLVYVLWRSRKLVCTNCVPTQFKSRPRIYDAECDWTLFLSVSADVRCGVNLKGPTVASLHVMLHVVTHSHHVGQPQTDAVDRTQLNNGIKKALIGICLR